MKTMKTILTLGLASLLLWLTPPQATAATGTGGTTANLDTRNYTLTVASTQGGNPVPGIGTHSTYCWRSTVTASVDAAVVGYTLTGWIGAGSIPDSGISNTTGEIVLNEVVSSIAWQWEINTYTVTFDLGGKSERIGGGALVQTVAHGDSALAPEVIADVGWVLAGWNKALVNITGALTITAVYTPPGTGTADNPYQIRTRQHLEAVNGNPSAYYILMNDIDLMGTTYARSPITSFSGTFDGNGFEIRNLTINGGGGLFGRIDTSGSVTNLGVVDCDISGGNDVGGLCGINYGTIASAYKTGVVSGGNYVGGVCGKNYGTIASAYATGMVSGGRAVGGLCGYNSSDYNNSGTITSCHATGSVSGDSSVGGLCGSTSSGTITSSYAKCAVSGGSLVGGLCGFNSGTITSSFATGSVTESRWSTGGLCGFNSGLITSSYAMGTVSGGGSYVSYVGGLCGNNSGTITSSYAMGTVSGNGSYVGGLCGQNSDLYRTKFGTITSSFWDTESSGRSTSDGGTGKMTDEMKDAGIFIAAGWDFEDVWVMSSPDSLNMGYPIMVWQTQEEHHTFTVVFDLGGKGTRTGGGGLAQQVASGGAAVAPEIVAQAGWTFAGWDRAFDSVTGDLAVAALYEAIHVVWVGNGTARNPYQISTRQHLEAVNNNLSAYYILVNDIDLSGTTYTRSVIAQDTSTSSEFQGTPFSGILDGNGFEIRNLTIEGGRNDYIGLFGKIGTGGAVVNLGVVDCDVTGSWCVGGVCGANGGIVDACYVKGTVSGSGYYVGGVCGENDAGIINLSHAAGTVSGGGYYVGGLCGYNRSGGSIRLSYATGTVSGLTMIGGFCGQNHRSTIFSSYATGAVAGGDYTGGLCGMDLSGTVTASFWDAQTSGQSTSGGGTAKTTAQMKGIGTFLDAGWDFDNVWMMSDPASENGGYPILQAGQRFTFAVTFVVGTNLYVHSGSAVQAVPFGSTAVAPIVYGDEGWVFAGWDGTFDNVRNDLTVTARSESRNGTGTPEDPYQIATRWQLEAVNQHLDGRYVLVNDIDLAGVKYDRAVIVPDTVIGFDDLTFKGVLDGSGFSVRNLHVNVPSDVSLFSGIQAGLIGWNEGTVKNLAVRGCRVVAEADSVAIGGLVGANGGTLANCYVSGTVIGKDRYVGGLAGGNYGQIVQCFADVDVQGDGWAVGGLVGGNDYGGVIRNCGAAGNVVGTLDVGNNNASVGGLVGEMDRNGVIANCYATGSVAGFHNMAGFIGRGWKQNTISHCYSRSALNSGVGLSGGFAGDYWLGDNTMVNSLWDTDTSGMAYDSSGALGLSSEAMKDYNVYRDLGWDFVETWAMSAPGSFGQGYPVLQWQVEERVTVAFDADDGAPPDTASKSVTFGAAYGTLATTTRTGYTFAGWWTDPGGTGTEVTAVTLMAAADPHTLYAKWVVNPTLTVNSLHGVTTPGLGSEPYDWGTALDCSVVSPVTLGTTQYVCTGWTGTGSVPSSGAGTNVSFTITEDSSIVWHWTTNYWLEATAVAGEGQVTGGDIWVAAGSEATLTASAEVGYRFDHWLLDGQPAGGTTNELVVLMDAMHAVEAGFVVLDLAEALDTPGRVWTTGGTTNWFPQTAVSHDGIDAARSGLISHRQTSWLETVVTNAGTLRFRWKVSSEAGFDWYSNRVDGVHQARISGETDWEQVSLRIEGLGPHTVRWEYSKDKSFSVGDDCGYLDEVVWLADAWLDTEVAGHGSVDVEDGWYHHGSNAVIRATPEAHHHFVGWSGDLDGCTTNGVELTAPMVQSRLVTAHFAADTYVATFDAQGGETPVPAGKTVAYNEAYGVLATVARTGYAWAGWWTAPDGGAEVTAETTVTATDDHVLHARWIPNGYTATFDGSGGAVSSETLEVVYDAAYGTLPTATRSGYAFGGWWTGNNGTGVAIGADSVVTTAADHTLHAQWTAKTYTVTYDAGGGTVEPSGKTVVFDAAYGELASPVRAGYRFDGWWTEGGGAGQEITALSPVSTADHHTLYAQWTANSYLVTFDAEDGTVAPAGQTVVFGAAYGALPVPNREGHAFGGWWDGDGGTGSQVDAATLVATAQDHSLHAKWLINAHSLTVNSDHGTPLPFVGTQLLDWGTNLACSVTSPDTQGATRYVCSGWSGSGSVPSAGTMTNTDVFALTNDSSITWSWSKEYLLDIEVSGHGEVDRTDTWCADGSNITVRATAASGNRFNHWTLDGVQTGGYTNAIDLLMDASRQLTAHFVVFDLPEAVDSVDLVWTNGEDAVWTPQISVTHDGIDAARSGLIPDYGSTWIQTTVSGKGTVSFWWKTSSEENCDFIHFHVNGAINQSRSGETDWAFVSLHFDSDEEHVLRWEYTKDKSDTAGEDCGWVDQVVWTPDAPPLTGFALWAHGRGIDGGDAAALFGQLNPVSGVPYGVEYACGTNLTTGAPLLNIRMVNGRPVVEVATQDPATLAHVAVRVVGTADLASGVWSLPIRPASNTDGKPANRDWYELSGVSPGRAFFKLVAGLRSADAPGSFAFWLAERDLSGDHAELFGQLSPERGVPYGLLYAFGDNLTPGAPLLNIRVVNGRPVVETPVQDAATLPYVDLRVVGSTNLADWTLPVAPAADTAGKPANRAWHAPAGTPPERAFFKIEAGLK